MALASQYTEEQKAAFVTLAQAKGRNAAAKKAKVSTVTISAWAKAAGVKFTHGKKPAAKKRKGKANGKANGHANGNANGHVRAIPPSAAGLDALHIQLTEALAGVTAMRTAFRQVFG